MSWFDDLLKKKESIEVVSTFKETFNEDTGSWTREELHKIDNTIPKHKKKRKKND